MKKLLLLLVIILLPLTSCLFDSGSLEFEDIIGSRTGKTRDSIFYEGSYLESYIPAAAWIRYPDTSNSRIADILFQDYEIEHALGEVMHLTITETRNGNNYTTYDGLIVYDMSHTGSDTLGLESMMYFTYDEIATGGNLYIGVSKFDASTSIKITIWPMYMKGLYPSSEDPGYLDLYEDLR